MWWGLVRERRTSRFSLEPYAIGPAREMVWVGGGETLELGFRNLETCLKTEENILIDLCAWGGCPLISILLPVVYGTAPGLSSLNLSLYIRVRSCVDW